MAKIDRFYGASKCRRNIDMGGWKRIGTFPPTLTLICSFCLLLRHLFDKHSGCDRSNGLIDVTEKKNVFINGGRMLSKTDVTSANTSETVSLKHGKNRSFLWSFQMQKKHRYGRVKTNRYVPSNINFNLQLLFVIATFIWQTQWMRPQ